MTDKEKDVVTIGQLKQEYDHALRAYCDDLYKLTLTKNNEHRVSAYVTDTIIPAMTKRDNLDSEASSFLIKTHMRTGN